MVTPEQNVKTYIGELVIQICQLTSQLEAANEQLKEKNDESKLQ